MAQEMVVKEPLTNEMIEAGADLTRRLDTAGIDLIAAFWFYYPETGRWRLVLSSDAVDREGPRSVYGRVQTSIVKVARKDSQPPVLGLQDITVVSPKHPVVQLVRRMVKAPTGVNSIRMTHNWVNQTFIEDAYIYRIK